MPYNGSGQFDRVYSWVTDAANGIDVRADRTDTDTNDIAAGLSNAICKDGQTTVTADIPFNGHKLTGLGAAATNGDAVRWEQWIAGLSVDLCEFRLTLTTGTPVTIADVTSSSTIYCSPYKGNRIALYDGSNWNVFSSAEMSIAVPAVALAIYDVFCYDNAGVPTLELAAWSGLNSRATALTTQDGVLVKSGATTRRYLGTFATNGSNVAVDSAATRWLWNYYNRVRRICYVAETATSWNYTTATIRQANANTANQINYLIGWLEEKPSFTVNICASNVTAGVSMYAAIGTDSVTAADTACLYNYGYVPAANARITAIANLTNPTITTVGRHYAAWLEFSEATGTTTWRATTAGSGAIFGEIWG